MDKQELGIGVLNEKTLHLALKKYFEPNEMLHEQEYKGYVADIKRGDEIIEIETRSFTNIRKKLDAFLSDCTVNIVYPIPVVKWIRWVDSASGEMRKKRKSPKRGRACDAFFELFKISDYLNHPNLTLTLVYAEITDYKVKTGVKRGRERSERVERVPEKIIGTEVISAPKDYLKLLPYLPFGEFTAPELATLNRTSRKFIWYVIKVLEKIGIVEECGKKGRAKLYKIL